MEMSDDGSAAENSSVSTIWTDPTVFPEHQVERVIAKLFAPCLLLVGTFGNIATICVMRRIKDHNSSQHAILVTLALSDFLLIQVGMWRRLLWNYFNIDMRLWHSLVCKLYFWLIYATTMQSSWLVTCVTVQRAMFITWPHTMRAVCTLRRTWIVVASLVFTTCILNLHFLVGFDITSDNVCDYGTVEYFHFFAAWTWVDMILSFFTPSLCLIVCDVILCMALFKAASTMSKTVKTTPSVIAERDHKTRKKTASKITVLCLTLSCTFIILTLPICIQNVLYFFVHPNLTPRSQAKQSLANMVLNVLCYSNSAVNFFLYCITGTRFRQEFVNWICGRSRRHFTASDGDVSAGTVKGKEMK